MICFCFVVVLFCVVVFFGFGMVGVEDFIVDVLVEIFVQVEWGCYFVYNVFMCV